MAKRFSTDVLIIGSGAAGLATALHLADDAKVTVISKDAVHGGATNRAQGGVAAVTAQDDSVEAHVADTIAAGGGLCDEAAVRMAVGRAPQAIRTIVGFGLDFDREGDGPHLTREGGHSHRRVLHVADATGAAIAKTLIDQASSHPNIDIASGRVAIDLITSGKLGRKPNRSLGAYVYDIEGDAVDVFEADYAVLATGGASKAYLYTSNPDGATGDGIAMAWRAGCRVANMEFNQFHPTCLYHPASAQPGQGSFLISEAVRGEGGRLLLPDGSRFMDRFHVRAELASRDVVARAIDHEMKRLGTNCVYLDISHKSADFIGKRFPTILKRCLELGLDIRTTPIPVVPAAHYTCGGVIVDLKSRTDIPGLYAVGETAYTGLHGANRLASNSLLECLVFAEAAASDIRERRTRVAPPAAPAPPDWDESRVSDSDEQVVLSHNWTELRRFMWDYVGIVRTNKRLERAQHRVDLLKQEIHDYYARHRVSADLIELRNLVHVAALIVRSALMRKESRGLHYTLDYPQTLSTARPSIVYPAADPLDVLQPFPALPSKARRSLANSAGS